MVTYSCCECLLVSKNDTIYISLELITASMDEVTLEVSFQNQITCTSSFIPCLSGCPGKWKNRYYAQENGTSNQ